MAASAPAAPADPATEPGPVAEAAAAGPQAAQEEPWTGHALWPTFLRRSLPDDLLPAAAESAAGRRAPRPRAAEEAATVPAPPPRTSPAA